MEQMRQERPGEMESTTQVQATLQRTISVSSELAMRMGQAELSQQQARSIAESAMETSKKALVQAAKLKEEQDKTAQQVSEILNA